MSAACSDDYTDDEEPPKYDEIREHEQTRIVMEKELKTILRTEELNGWAPSFLEANILDSGRVRNFGDGSLLAVVRTAPFSASQHANVHLLGRTLKRTPSGRPGGTLKGWQAGARKMFVALSANYESSQRSTSLFSRADGSASRPTISLLDSDDSDATEYDGGADGPSAAARQTETEKMAAHADLVMEVASAQDHGRPVEPHDWAPDVDLWIAKESAFRNPPFDPPPARFSYSTRGDAYKGLPTPTSKGRGANKMYTHKKLDGKGERERFGRHFRCLADGRGFRKVAGRTTGPDDYFSGVSGASLPWFDGEGSDVDDGEGGTVVPLECTRVAGKEFAEIGKALMESTLGDHAKATREAFHKVVYASFARPPARCPAHACAQKSETSRMHAVAMHACTACEMGGGDERC